MRTWTSALVLRALLAMAIGVEKMSRRKVSLEGLSGRDSTCGVCGSHDRSVLYRIADWRLARPSPDYGVTSCESCGHGYLWPAPEIDDIAAHYPSGYDSGRTLEDPTYRRRINRQLEFIGPPSGRLLDWGAANGMFLDVADRAGWEAVGFEPYQRISGSHPDVVRSLDELPSSLFDAVCAWHVIEHSIDPVADLLKARQFLAPGGFLFVSLPNFDSLWARGLKAEDVPRHLQFFTQQSLERAANEAGFDVVAMSFDPAFATGASGRGISRRLLSSTLSGTSTYDFLAGGQQPASQEWARPLQRIADALERRLFTDASLERSRTSGVMAAKLQDRSTRS